MQKRIKSPKRAVNLSIDARLLAEAKAAGTNLSAVLEQSLRLALHQRRENARCDENRSGIEASNQELEDNGLWADRYRTW